MALLVLGVVRQGHPSPPATRKGDDAFDVRLVDSGDLAAAVTDIDDETPLTEDDAARHLDTLILLLRDGPVLPLAFGTVSPDEDAVRTEVLDATAGDLAERLDSVDGFVETRLEVNFDEQAALRDIMENDPNVRGMAAQTKEDSGALDLRLALGEAVSARLMDWRRLQVDALLPRLTGPVHSVAELESQEPLQQRWAFLVSADRLGELDQAVGEQRSTLGKGASVEYVGPLPVYSFLAQATDRPAGQGSAWGW
jgi:Gas vesicle synthesis protein GvpL/GvpF